MVRSAIQSQKCLFAWFLAALRYPGEISDYPGECSLAQWVRYLVAEVLRTGWPTVAPSRATSAVPLAIRSRSPLSYGPLSYGPSQNRDLLSHAQLGLPMTEGDEACTCREGSR
jgi:hypothetical protein